MLMLAAGNKKKQAPYGVSFAKLYLSAVNLKKN